ncbi:MAG: hypothetical protein U5N86_02900 [Planctomycetota bacterium]|nr:hypothetical protein [Planctomycetota bacterium]
MRFSIGYAFGLDYVPVVHRNASATSQQTPHFPCGIVEVGKLVKGVGAPDQVHRAVFEVEGWKVGMNGLRPVRNRAVLIEKLKHLNVAVNHDQRTPFARRVKKCLRKEAGPAAQVHYGISRHYLEMSHVFRRVLFLGALGTYEAQFPFAVALFSQLPPPDRFT